MLALHNANLRTDANATNKLFAVFAYVSIVCIILFISLRNMMYFFFFTYIKRLIYVYLLRY